ncbi:DUF2911 domain-containing protein [Confluentibacter lentus]|uniref:DUF2911 domain-containing protein n=1 Tax=Confluentibacter lentus TaxID=1699412 RepID=UPI000C295792|nr:DUF2911 domain-containing protein [Confluentibacter lentus]
MKKTTFLTTIALVFGMLFSINTHAQKFASVDKSPLDITYYRTERTAPPMIKVIYSRPQLNGRELSKLAPIGKVWRTGANEATEIKFFQDMTFGGKPVKAGTYSLFSIPGETEWTIILNSDLDVWGAFSYKEANDVLRVNVPASTGEAVDDFSIVFENNNMYLAWGTTRVAVPVSK